MSVNKARVMLWVVQGVLVVVVLGGGLWVARYLMSTKPTAARGKQTSSARLVTTTTMERGKARVVIEAMGTVQAAKEVEVVPRVSGQVVQVSEEFVPGGRLGVGDLIVRIDPTDYRLVVNQKRSDVSKAEAEVRKEEGNQKVAAREYEMLGKTMSETDRELMLRKPQLNAVRASLEAAQAQLEKAELDLARTEIRSPMNAIVASKSLELGGQASVNASMAKLVGTDEYWVKVSVAVDDLRWLEIPMNAGETGSKVRVHDVLGWGEQAEREGRVVRLEGGLEPGGRMAQVIVAVDDPLCLKPQNKGKPMLLIDAYVSVEIEGKELEDVVTLDRRLLREDDSVWEMNGEKKLEIKPVKVVHRGRETVLVSQGIDAGAKVVSSDLSGATAGMELREAESGAGAMAESGKESGNGR